MYCDPSGHFDLFTLLTTIATTAFATIIAITGLVLTGYGVGLGLNAIKRQGVDKDNEPSEDKKNDYLDVPYKGDGFSIDYNIVPDKYDPSNKNKYILKVYESWRFSEKEIDEFLRWLKYYKGYDYLNVGRVKNEWLWHNAMYGFGFATDSTRRVDVYLNAADPNWGWFFDFFRVW